VQHRIWHGAAVIAKHCNGMTAAREGLAPRKAETLAGELKLNSLAAVEAVHGRRMSPETPRATLKQPNKLH
jgi:hypothetical protein